MKLTIKNIGKLKEAEVEINGITVITGENDTGKSTVGKVLWSIFNSFFEITEKVYNEKKLELAKIISEIMKENGYDKIKDNFENFFGIFDRTESNIAIELLANNKIYTENDIKFIINKHKENLKVENIYDFVNEINDTLSLDNKEIIKIIISRIFNKEFNNQINTVFPKKNEEKKAEIELVIKNRSINFNIMNNEILNIESYFLINKEVMYIDNPFVLDSYNYEEENHQTHLGNSVFSKMQNNVISEIKIKKKLNSIYRNLNKILNGEILENKDYKFVYKKNGEEIDLKNLSTGLKTFAIIKMLLQNGALEENGTIILDEPEIHLHPEWQLKFAELIVLLQKEFGMHILLTTHSPYFFKAIQVYSKKYEIEDKCKYYLSENVGESSILIDKTENTEDIYYKMAIPFENLMNEEELL